MEPVAINESACIRAQAHLHHAWFIGLQLAVAADRSAEVVGDWTFALFRRQQQEKFLPGLRKLELDGLPHAVACARYHVLANRIGGVQVEYIHENDRKAWVRFRYPRWLHAGPALCGLPVEAGRGFMRGWYAHNGVSLNNPRLGFVCVSEDLTGEFGFCGYFREFDKELAAHERLQFARDELPPPWREDEQPRLRSVQWSPERLTKARRNYAVDFVRNAIVSLAATIAPEEARELAARSARLIGLQYFQETRQMVGAQDGDLDSAVDYLQRMFLGMGDRLQPTLMLDAAGPRLMQDNPRFVRGMSGAERELLLDCWTELWVGALRSFREMKQLRDLSGDDDLTWELSSFADRDPSFFPG